MSACPICTSEAEALGSSGGRRGFDCVRCGRYSISDEALEDLPSILRGDPRRQAILSNATYRMVQGGDLPLLTSSLAEQVVTTSNLSRPQEQLENLILWFGSVQETPGDTIGPRVPPSAIAAADAQDFDSVGFLLREGIERRLIAGEFRGFGRPESSEFGIDATVRLSMDGWKLYEELQRGRVASRRAFMAMQFGDEELTSIYQDYFKPAVDSTGFDLKKLDDEQPAGLIDDRLRIEIRQSRFLIADLTHHNNGAYWEAGFAEGLGKPVIFTCRKDVFDDADGGTHFDTNHSVTVVWEPSDVESAVRKLKDTIRATLPGEAKMED